MPDSSNEWSIPGRLASSAGCVGRPRPTPSDRATITPSRWPSPADINSRTPATATSPNIISASPPSTGGGSTVTHRPTAGKIPSSNRITAIT